MKTSARCCHYTLSDNKAAGTAAPLGVYGANMLADPPRYIILTDGTSSN